MRYIRASDQDETRIRQFLGQFPTSHWSQNLAQYINVTLGGVFLSLDEDSKILGCAALAGEKTREMYIAGIRVADENQDLAQEFADYLVQEALQSGAQLIRALVGDEDEMPSRLFKEYLQFQRQTAWEIGTLTELSAPQDHAAADAGPAWAVDRERLFTYLANHPHQLWAANDVWLPRLLTEEDLALGFELGGAAVVPQDAEQPIAALALYRIKNRERLNLGYISAENEDSLHTLLAYLLVETHAWGATELRYGLPQEQAQALVAWYQKPVESRWRGWLLERVLSPATVPS